MFIFSTPVLIRHLRQLETVVFLHWCLILAVLLFAESFAVKIRQVIPKGKVSLYGWTPVWLVWNQLYDYLQFLFLFAKQTNPNQLNRRSMVQWCSLQYSLDKVTFNLKFFVKSFENTHICSLYLSFSLKVLRIPTLALSKQGFPLKVMSLYLKGFFMSAVTLVQHDICPSGKNPLGNAANRFQIYQNNELVHF
jgi:hypothetical protein